MLDLSEADGAFVLALIRRRLPLCTAIAFGSRVSGWPSRGVAKPYSDLDIALWALMPSDDLALAHLRADLEESRLPWRVDLSNAQDLPDALQEMVRRRGMLLQVKIEQQAQAT